MVRGNLTAIVLLPLLLGSAADDLSSQLRVTADAFLANIAAIAPVAGRDTTYDYFERLNEDAAMLGDPSVPDGYTSAQWSQTVRATAALDLSLATQLLEHSYRSMASIRGLGEALVPSSRDGTLQPVAVYVPSSYVPGRPVPLVVMLHGRPQSETLLLGAPFLRQIAEQTGTVVVAPWGHGYYDFRGSATDVYDALHAAQRAFTIDPRKQFLVGYSMGGFSVFKVAPVHPNEWSAVMSIAGSLLGSDSSRVVALMSRTPFYVLTGSNDASIPTEYPTVTAAFLHAAGMEVSFYSEPTGTHHLSTLMPILLEAWNDMLHEIVRTAPEPIGNVSLPSAIPVMTLRP